MGMKKYKIGDWIGKRVNSLVITGVVTKDKRGKPYWECICDCGKVLNIAPERLVKSIVMSCRQCYYKRITGAGSYNYQGSAHIPASILSALTKGALRRSKDIPVEITINDLEDQWVKQSGTCPYTGIKLTIKTTGGDASVDRIDSSKGYTKDNIQFVHKRINIMKMDMSEEDFLLMCKLVATNVSRDREDT